MSDFELLQQFSRGGSQEAFAELMNRHIHWVYSLCRQEVHDPGLAEDVTQAVFVTLARKASTMRNGTRISGWLFITSRYAAKSALKIAERRRRHERQAATMTPESTPSHADAPRESDLDAALASLQAADREAVILRFFRGLTHQSMAETLGITEAAARKRVERAIVRLRGKLRPGAAAAGIAAISAVLSQRAAQAAPVDLAARNLSAMTIGPSAKTQAILKGMTAMKRIFAVKIAAGATVAVLVAGMATIFALQSPVSAPAQNPASGGASQLSADSAPAQSIPKYDLSTVQVFRISGIENGVQWANYYSPKQNAVIHQISAPGWSTSHYVLDQTEWDIRDGGSLILQKIPVQDARRQIDKMKSDLSSLQNAPATRRPDLDEKIDGALCQAYHLQDGPGQSLNTFVYIDTTTGRPARAKSDKPASDIVVAYDPPVAADFFKVPSGDGIETALALDYFEKKYPLDHALFQQEGVGQIFAVNEATQDAAGCFHIVCSCRLSPAVRKDLADLPDDQEVGKFKVEDGGNPPFHFMILAEAHESGMQVTYLLVIPNNPPAPGDICQLPITMGSSDTILKTGHAPRGPRGGHDVHILVKLEVKPQTNVPTAHDFGARAYDDVAPLVGIASETRLGFGPDSGAGLPSKEDSLPELDQKLSQYLPDIPDAADSGH